MKKDNNYPELKAEELIYPYKDKLKRSAVLSFEGTEEELEKIMLAEEDIEYLDKDVMVYHKLRLHPEEGISMPRKASMKKPTKRNKWIIFGFSTTIAACFLVCIFLQKNEPHEPLVIIPTSELILEKKEPKIELEHKLDKKDVSTDTSKTITKPNKKIKESLPNPKKSEPVYPVREKYQFTKLKSTNILAENMLKKEVIVPVYVQTERINPTIEQENKPESFILAARNFIKKNIFRENSVDINEWILANQSSELEIITGNYPTTTITQEFDNKGTLIKTCIYTKPINYSRLAIQ